jgi:hypothetical protein
MKKKLTALLAVSLAVLSAFPVNAFAASSKYSTKITATATIPNITVAVTVPTGGSTYINPKQVSANIAGKMQDDQISSGPAWIENKSEVPISVSVSVTGSVNKRSNMWLSDTSTKGSTSKEAFVYFEMQTVADPKNVTWDASYNADKHILVTYGTEEKEDYITIGAASQAKHFGAFRLSGDCVAEPEDDPWTTRDSFTAKIVFTFKPLPYTSDG